MMYYYFYDNVIPLLVSTGIIAYLFGIATGYILGNATKSNDKP